VKEVLSAVSEHTYSTTRGTKTLIWDVGRLWELAADLPAREVPVKDLEHLLDEQCWFNTHTLVPTARAVAEHSEKIHSADLSYPIILSRHGEVMDGMHRLAKAWMQGLATIWTVQFQEDPTPDWEEDADEVRD